MAPDKVAIMAIHYLESSMAYASSNVEVAGKYDFYLRWYFSIGIHVICVSIQQNAQRSAESKYAFVGIK